MPEIPDAEEIERVVYRALEDRLGPVEEAVGDLQDEMYVFKEWLSVGEAVRYVGEAWRQAKIRRLAQEGKVRAVKRDRRWFINRESLKAYIEQGASSTNTPHGGE